MKRQEESRAVIGGSSLDMVEEYTSSYTVLDYMSQQSCDSDATISESRLEEQLNDVRQASHSARQLLFYSLLLETFVVVVMRRRLMMNGFHLVVVAVSPENCETNRNTWIYIQI